MSTYDLIATKGERMVKFAKFALATDHQCPTQANYCSFVT